MACILCFNTIAFLIALTVIPFLYFFIGKYYLKEKEDKKHLKIHNALISLITMSIVLFFIICLFSYLTGYSVLILGCILMMFNLLVSPSLYLNALGGSKVLDFVMGIFIKYSET